MKESVSANKKLQADDAREIAEAAEDERATVGSPSHSVPSALAEVVRLLALGVEDGSLGGGGAEEGDELVRSRAPLNVVHRPLLTERYPEDLPFDAHVVKPALSIIALATPVDLSMRLHQETPPTRAPPELDLGRFEECLRGREKGRSMSDALKHVFFEGIHFLIGREKGRNMSDALKHVF